MSLFLATIVIVGSSGIQSATGESTPNLAEVALRYVEAENKRQAVGAGESEVDAALSFLADDVVYEHPRVGIRIEGKEPLRQGMLAFLGTVRNHRDAVISSVEGVGVVVLELEQFFETGQDDGWSSQTRRVVKVLEFRGTTISRVIDFW